MRSNLKFVPFQAIVALFAFVALTATIGSGLFIYQGRASALDKAESELKNLAFVLVEQTDQALQAVELVQKDIIERIRYEAMDGRSFSDVAQSDAIFSVLTQKADELPHVSGFAIVRKDGLTLSTSQGREKYRPISVSDREYFRDVMAEPKIVSKISKVTTSRIAAASTIFVSRKITSAGGEVLGVINAALDIDYFSSLYGRLISKSGLTTTLLGKEGNVLAQHPAVTEQGRTPSMLNDIRPLLNSTDSPAISAFTGQRGESRLVAVKASSSFPFAIAVSDAYGSILADWRLQAAAIAITVVLMNIAIVIALLLGRRQMQSSALRAATESYIARHDVLTKTPNRLYFLEEMRRTIDQSIATGRQFGLVVIDLRRFKEINDALGHPTGDRVIQSVAGRLKQCALPENFVARIGGDEFAVILRRLDGLDQVRSFADRLVDCLAEPHAIDDKTLQCKCSIGISIGLSHGSNADDLLKAADLALSAVRTDPDVGYRLYDAELNAERLKQRDIEAALPDAIGNNEFELHYQPIVSLKTGRYWGFEGLVRWRRPGHGLVPPSDFIPTLESAGLIIPLGQKLLRDACRAATTWPASTHVSVNVSPIQLASDCIIDHVREALETSKLAPRRLTIEVTESVLLGDGAVERLRAIRAMGVCIALDDFGTGFASMSYLETYPYDKIKIDKSFVANLANLWGKAKFAALTFNSFHNPLKYFSVTAVVLRLKVPQLRQSASATSAECGGGATSLLSLFWLLERGDFRNWPLLTASFQVS